MARRDGDAPSGRLVVEVQPVKPGSGDVDRQPMFLTILRQASGGDLLARRIGNRVGGRGPVPIPGDHAGTDGQFQGLASPAINRVAGRSLEPLARCRRTV